MAKKTVKINCKGAGEINIDQLSPLQGALKILTDDNYAKFKAEIERDGFIEPISIWEDPKTAKLYILNGHQRVDGLKRMREEGWKIPQIPVNMVEAKDLGEAKRKLLALASQYGIVSAQGLFDFASEAGITREEIQTHYSFPDFDPDRFLQEYFPEGPKTMPQVEVPQAAPVVTVVGDAAAPIQAPPPAPKQEKKSVSHQTGEINASEFENFDHECPRCKFQFNDKK